MPFTALALLGIAHVTRSTTRDDVAYVASRSIRAQLLVDLTKGCEAPFEFRAMSKKLEDNHFMVCTSESGTTCIIDTEIPQLRVMAGKAAIMRTVTHAGEIGNKAFSFDDMKPEDRNAMLEMINCYRDNRVSPAGVQGSKATIFLAAHITLQGPNGPISFGASMPFASREEWDDQMRDLRAHPVSYTRDTGPDQKGLVIREEQGKQYPVGVLGKTSWAHLGRATSDVMATLEAIVEKSTSQMSELLGQFDSLVKKRLFGDNPPKSSDGPAFANLPKNIAGNIEQLVRDNPEKYGFTSAEQGIAYLHQSRDLKLSIDRTLEFSMSTNGSAPSLTGIDF